MKILSEIGTIMAHLKQFALVDETLDAGRRMMFSSSWNKVVNHDKEKYRLYITES